MTGMFMQLVASLCLVGFALWLHERAKHKALAEQREQHKAELEETRDEAADTYATIAEDVMNVFGPAVEKTVREKIEADVRREIKQRDADFAAWVHRVNVLCAMSTASGAMRRARVC